MAGKIISSVSWDLPGTLLIGVSAIIGPIGATIGVLYVLGVYLVGILVGDKIQENIKRDKNLCKKHKTKKEVYICELNYLNIIDNIL